MLIPEHFRHLRNPTSTGSNSTFLPSPGPWKPLTYFLGLWNCLFWTFHVNGIHAVCGPMSVASSLGITCSGFSVTLQSQILCSVSQDILFIHSSLDGHLAASHFGTITNNTAVNGVQVSVWTSVFISLVCKPGSGIVGSNDSSAFGLSRGSVCRALHDHPPAE